MKLFNSKFSEIIKAAVDRVNDTAGRFNIVFGLAIVSFLGFMLFQKNALWLFSKIQLYVNGINNLINFENEIGVDPTSASRAETWIITAILVFIEIYICTLLSIINKDKPQK